ncbi:HAD family hydrolase [Nitratireductor pacificus]|uniref:HAD-superfamily hydrolase n=1 Tax=Nitratireductor pacificus pht-3B TaxID=391937 RepID=K2N944_9HYPH|nr:HAD family phosphatase [Nitratireductor pacificus]EKF20623.1 HAD-superfamily hydrolase [Nitratireductor pacificus pht-3B]
MKGLLAVAWDIDGTLIDSEPLHHRALLAASTAHGVDLSGDPKDRFVGVHMNDVWTALQPLYPPSLSRERWQTAINRFYCEAASSLEPMPNARRVIETLSGLGVPQICVSNSGRAVVDANIARLGIAPFLAGAISLDDLTNGKPAPEGYLLAAQRLGVPAQAVLAVEDSGTGLAAARAAGLSTAGFVPDGGALPGADRQIRRLDELLDWFA